MSNIPLPTIVLFDMDGTTVRHVHPRLLNALEFIDDVGYKSSRFFARLMRRKKDLQDFSDEPAKKKRLLVHRALHKLRRKDVEQIVQPCPGIYKTLSFFKDKNIPMGIVSNGLGKGYGHDILEKFNLEQFFEVQLFREDIQKSKPHPDPILRALKAIKEEPEPSDVVWYIGDRHKDVVAAIAANGFTDCKIIPFAYGFNAAVAVLKNNVGTDHIIMNYPDFTARVAEMIEEAEEENTANSDKTNQRSASKSAS